MNTGHDEGKCSQYDRYLEDYLTGDLSRGAASKLAAHLNECRACRDSLADARLASRLVSTSFDPAPEPGPAFTRRVMAQVSAAERWINEQRTFWRPLETLAWRLTFSAALALSFLFAYGIRLNAPPAPAPVATAATTAFGQQSDAYSVLTTAPANGDEVLMAIAERQHGK